MKSRKRRTRKRFWNPNEGITQSMLGTFLSCRKKAYYGLIDGLRQEKYGSALEFGLIVHHLLEYGFLENGDVHTVNAEMDRYIKQWESNNPLVDAESLQQIELLAGQAQIVVEEYFSYWDCSKYNWVGLEQVFGVEYDIPGQTKPAYLRGKLDGVFTDCDGDYWLFETKTKGFIDESLVDILAMERQVQLYSIAIEGIWGKYPKGVLYSVIRRPQLRQGKSESLNEFLDRLRTDIKSRPDWYFRNINIAFTQEDISQMNQDISLSLKEFRKWGNNPSKHTFRNTNECSKPWGTCEYLGMCSRGDDTGLVKKDSVFSELETEE